MKNPAAVALGRKGGLAKSKSKTEANRRNVLKRWKMIGRKREGKV
jgi:hypothetical protein